VTVAFDPNARSARDFLTSSDTLGGLSGFLVFRHFKNPTLRGPEWLRHNSLIDFLFIRSLRKPIGVAFIVFENLIGNEVANIAAQCNRPRYMREKIRDSIFISMVPIDSAWVPFSPDGKTGHLMIVVNIGIQ
jgi:hypothetical protein